MKVLIISKYFEPQNTPRAFRTAELAYEMVRQGHEVSLMIPEILGVSNTENYPFRIISMGKLSWMEVSLNAAGIFLFVRRIIRRLMKLIFEYPDIELFFKVKKNLEMEKEYDLLVSIAVPHSIHWGVAWIQSNKFKVAKTWIADCGDPFMGAENDTFQPPFYFLFVEKWFCRIVDYITVPVDTAIQAYYQEFRFKISVIPQGFNFDDLDISTIKVDNDVPTFIYAGGLIPGKRDPQKFLEYLNSLTTEFKFILYTQSGSLIDSVVKKSNNRIELRDYISRNKLFLELRKADFVINFENVGNKQIPSKLIDYAILNKPILSVDTSCLDRESIDQFLVGDYNKRKIVLNIDQYRIKNVCQEFIRLVTHD